jgi:hypothetical protein
LFRELLDSHFNRLPARFFFFEFYSHHIWFSVFLF